MEGRRKKEEGKRKMGFATFVASIVAIEAIGGDDFPFSFRHLPSVMLRYVGLYSTDRVFFDIAGAVG